MLDYLSKISLKSIHPFNLTICILLHNEYNKGFYKIYCFFVILQIVLLNLEY